LTRHFGPDTLLTLLEVGSGFSMERGSDRLRASTLLR